jgi:DNA polymerase-3 subunit gamma/tau
VLQQLALQSELVECRQESGATVLQIRVPVETYRSGNNVDKLAVAVSEHFGKPVRIGSEIGAVRFTASAVAQADRASRQLAAEDTMNNDPFVQTLMREFNAFIVPGSIKTV